MNNSAGNYGLRLSWRIFIIAIMLCGLILVSILLRSKIKSLEAQHDPSIHIQTLETYYLEKQFDSLEHYLTEYSLYEDMYSKYWEIIEGHTCFQLCLTLKSEESQKPFNDLLYKKYRNRLQQIYATCDSENRPAIKTFLALS